MNKIFDEGGDWTDWNVAISGSLTYAGATHGDDAESLDDASRADDPRHPDEENDAKDVLHAREVDAGQGAQLGRAFRLIRRVRIRRGLHRSAVVGQRANQRRYSRAAFFRLLLKH